MKINFVFILRSIIGLAILAVVSGLLVLGFRVALDPKGAGTRETIRLGAYEGDVGALEWIAKDKGFFERAGIDVTLLGYPSGNAAVEAMRGGFVDVATAADLVVAKRSFTENDIRVVADICRYWNKGLVARRDRGIATSADLRAKRIGVPFTSSAEHNLMVFLAMEGLAAEDVAIVNIPAEKIADAIAGGQVDAAMVWQPHVATIRERLGDNAVVLMDGGTEAHLLLLTSRKTVIPQTKALRKMLNGLILAEEWVRANPAEAKAYLSARFNLSAEYVEMLWPRMQFAVSLPQEILEAMDSEARWIAKAGTAQPAPNFVETIHPDILRSIRPEAVGVFVK